MLELKTQDEVPSGVAVIETEIETGAGRSPTISTSPASGKLNVDALAWGARANTNVSSKTRDKIKRMAKHSLPEFMLRLLLRLATKPPSGMGSTRRLRTRRFGQQGGCCPA